MKIRVFPNSFRGYTQGYAQNLWISKIVFGIKRLGIMMVR